MKCYYFTRINNSTFVCCFPFLFCLLFSLLLKVSLFLVYGCECWPVQNIQAQHICSALGGKEGVTSLRLLVADASESLCGCW